MRVGVRRDDYFFHKDFRTTSGAFTFVARERTEVTRRCQARKEQSDISTWYVLSPALVGARHDKVTLHSTGLTMTACSGILVLWYQGSGTQ